MDWENISIIKMTRIKTIKTFNIDMHILRMQGYFGEMHYVFKRYEQLYYSSQPE